LVVPNLFFPRNLSVVVRHDQVRVARHLEPAAVDPSPGQLVHLGQQHPRVDHHPVADDRRDVVVEDPAGQQLQGEGLTVDHDGVPGVVAALVADHQLHLLGQQVGQLPFALITPLGADDDGGSHRIRLLVRRGASRPEPAADQRAAGAKRMSRERR
jgi:hypothetical protein